jgi:hypothetical protein
MGRWSVWKSSFCVSRRQALISRAALTRCCDTGRGGRTAPCRVDYTSNIVFVLNFNPDSSEQTFLTGKSRPQSPQCGIICGQLSSYFPLGSFSLCFRKHISLIMAYCTIPRIGLHNFLYQFRAATPPKQRKLEF